MMFWFVIIGAAFAAGWAAVTPETYGLVDSRTQSDELSNDWRERLARDECPRCGEPLDTGWQCAVTSKACGFDAYLLIQTEREKPQ